jgi:hypothetical protein
MQMASANMYIFFFWVFTLFYNHQRRNAGIRIHIFFHSVAWLQRRIDDYDLSVLFQPVNDVLVAQMMTKGAEVVHTLPFGASSNLMKLLHHLTVYRATNFGYQLTPILHEWRLLIFVF